ncbi:M3 family oligoendopeptidase [Bacillus sp. BHET2]|uniref:M3 family oligoendopeptidase n=1 Tax=Bacillus sp. BHET2 TaxID=2583818 RepID=UPI00110DCFA0|nr:M3 family oligoendopeptidase [Bacillus sp. BHET2]TMU85814.1 M3 family oligoendopeptidase [Bacillus sp. BHET2]
MKFNNLIYERPNMEEFEERIAVLLENFRTADNFIEQSELIDQINTLRNDVLTMLTIAQIRSHLDTADTQYQEEQSYINRVWPIYEKIVASYYEHLLESPFKKDINIKYGDQLLKLASVNHHTISTEVIVDLRVENDLVSEYTKLMAQSKIEFEGVERTLSQLDAFLFSNDRQIRKQAGERKYELLSRVENKVDEIFDALVQVRTRIANTLGYSSFVELGYARLSRVDYGQADVDSFRDFLKTYLVPFSEKMREEQRIRLGIEKLTYYDEDIRSLSGDAVLNGNSEWIVSHFGKVLNELSLDAGKLYTSLTERNLMDLTHKEGKMRGAYSTYLCNVKQPYIFASLNGTRKDIKVLSHEFGHAFQMSHFKEHHSIPEYIVPTKEACEITSIAMEFFIWSYLDDFIGDDADKYRYSHLEDAIFSMPCRAAIDEFQYFVYKNPGVSPSVRKEIWSEIEQKYMPYKYSYDHPFLKRGAYWQQQVHLFTLPFYYIDYAVAQLCALQLWAIAQVDEGKAWEMYMKLCELGGSKSFLELLDISGIASPFDEKGFISIVGVIENWLEKQSMKEERWK